MKCCRSSWVMLLVALALTALETADARAEESTVIWLSWDGVRHDYPARGDFPGLARMAREGGRAERLVPVYPSSTFPNHVALATCTHSDRHGIIENRFLDRTRGEFAYDNDASWIQAEPIWVAAERQGVTSATFFWVGSETDWEGVGARYRVAPFDAKVGEAAKVDQILAWLDLPDAERPRLILSWWHGADEAGHRRGPAHRDVAQSLAEQDRELQRLMRGLDARKRWSETTLIVTSDHGMTEASVAIDVAGALEDAGLEAKVRSGSAVANVYLADPKSREAARRAISVIEGAVVFDRVDLPDVLRLRHPDRSGDLVVITEPPFYFESQDASVAWMRWITHQFGYKTGHHGYSTSHPDMSGIFFMLGRGVGAEVNLGVVRNLAVAPTVASLLGIEPPRDCEGSAIPEAARRVASDGK